MEFKTFENWDEEAWNKVRPIYLKTFAGKGAKPEKIIRNMFRREICFLHTLEEEDRVFAMALTGKLSECHSLLIDYLAVNEESRGEGIGHKMVKDIKSWAIDEERFQGIIIEVEADKTAENLERIDFWRNCGFTLTEYIHHYIWVPEPYQAMYVKLDPSSAFSERGEDLFKYIGRFHKASFTGR